MIHFLKRSTGVLWWFGVSVAALGCSSGSVDGTGNPSTGTGPETLRFGSTLGGGTPGGGGVPGSSSSSQEEESSLDAQNADSDATSLLLDADEGDTLTGIEDSSEETNTENLEEDGSNPFAYECNVGEVEECETECGSIGTRLCNKIWGPCEPPQEVCNGVDDDCNGIVDDVPPELLSEETCDGEDNDCDGLIDEDIAQACPCDGPDTFSDICTNGIWSGCPTIQDTVLLVDIPSLGANCPWGEGDNLSAKSGAFAARVEQTVPFNLPEGAQLCSFTLTGGSDSFYYDDHLLLLFNGTPLIGSFNFNAAFDFVDGLPHYDWSKILGKTWSDFGDNITYCIEGSTECAMPGTQQDGVVALAFDEATNSALADSVSGGQVDFTMVVTGDNDPSVDCYHSGIQLELDVQYVLENTP